LGKKDSNYYKNALFCLSVMLNRSKNINNMQPTDMFVENLSTFEVEGKGEKKIVSPFFFIKNILAIYDSY